MHYPHQFGRRKEAKIMRHIYADNAATTRVAPEVAELASATECTGLIPSAVRTPGQARSYADLYAIHEQKPAHDAEE